MDIAYAISQIQFYANFDRAVRSVDCCQDSAFVTRVVVKRRWPARPWLARPLLARPRSRLGLRPACAISVLVLECIIALGRWPI